MHINGTPYGLTPTQERTLCGHCFPRASTALSEMESGEGRYPRYPRAPPWVALRLNAPLVAKNPAIADGAEFLIALLSFAGNAATHGDRVRFVPSLLAFGVGAALSVFTAALAYLTQIVHTEHPYANSELVAGRLRLVGSHAHYFIRAGCLLCRDDPRRILPQLNLVVSLSLAARPPVLRPHRR